MTRTRTRWTPLIGLGTAAVLGLTACGGGGFEDDGTAASSRPGTVRSSCRC